MWLLIVLVVVVFGLLYYYYKKQINFWDKEGVPNVKPKNVLQMFGIGSGKTMMDTQKETYNLLDLRYFGIVIMSPTLLIKDPELIKIISVKEFDTFMDHRTFIPEGVDPMWNKNLFGTTGHRWRQLRPVLSPSFTSSKMKMMFVLMQQCGEQLANYFLEKNEDIVEVELFDVFGRYTNDVVATTAFGIKCDSLKEPDNAFYATSKKVTDLSGVMTFAKMFAFMMLNPTLMKVLGMRLFSKKIVSFYDSIIKETIKIREEKHIIRPDLVHILMEARKGNKNEEADLGVKEFASVKEYDLGSKNKVEKPALDDEDILAQAMIFFFAGFDTSATVMCFAGYELALNTDCQQKLYEEIVQTNKECNGKITYEALLKMKYLDMVISETLRMWPPQPATDRIANRDYVIEPVLPNEKSYLVKKGTVVIFPIVAIHFDPQWYPNPDKFDPERFSDENKHIIHPFAYLPFGAGPRNCIGSRFALLEIKLLLFNILLKFEIVPTAKSQIPVKLKVASFTPKAKNGFHFGFKRRTSS